ncbi:hypothetical protein scyTo_0001331 [Scyliorhinus torazame]|uniref:Uncharacterized protein n=1 Tax=Scyliorhinus torazame TaxID=75743 RepID=A0A401PBZ0_SCYTO|nr:hypothetical protein [Scyliorhinus torazame]
MAVKFTIESPDVTYNKDYIEEVYPYQTTHDYEENGPIQAFKDLLPTVNPNDTVFDGWDISSMNLSDAMVRAQALDWQLQEQLKPHKKTSHPRPSVHIPEFIAANQEDRADNLIKDSKKEQVEQIRKDIGDFNAKSGVSKVIILWTVHFCHVIPGVNGSRKSHEGD